MRASRLRPSGQTYWWTSTPNVRAYWPSRAFLLCSPYRAFSKNPLSRAWPRCTEVISRLPRTRTGLNYPRAVPYVLRLVRCVADEIANRNFILWCPWMPLPSPWAPLPSPSFPKAQLDLHVSLLWSREGMLCSSTFLRSVEIQAQKFIVSPGWRLRLPWCLVAHALRNSRDLKRHVILNN